MCGFRRNSRKQLADFRATQFRVGRWAVECSLFAGKDFVLVYNTKTLVYFNMATHKQKQ